MLRILFALFLILHGLIHLMGFAKAFQFAELSQLTHLPSRSAGLLWLICALVFTAAGGLFLFRHASWWWAALVAVVLSQVLIFLSWGDARFGTVANVIILVPAIAAALEARPGSFSNRYDAAVREGLARYTVMPLVTEADLSHLPAPVEKYLHVSGAVGKPRIHNFRATFTGDFRNGLQSSWMRFKAQQYDFLDEPARVFLMKASMYGLPAEGLHVLRSTGATMQIKVASLLPVADARGPQMNQGETVTLFNDMCVLAPASLIDRERIQWEPDGPLAARARFTRAGITITARLLFNEAGELVNFVSTDRFYSTDGKTFKNYPWSTPVRTYREVERRKVASYAEAAWHTPDGEFTYGKFNLVEIEYNVGKLERGW